MTADNSRGIFVSIDTPNIWITADLTKSDWSLTGPAAAFGGWAGSFYQSIARSGMFQKECKDFSSLLSVLETYKGKIWGFVLYAHGSPAGVISGVPSGRLKHYQQELIDAVAKCGYKLAEIHLMQCYSGYKGLIKTYKEEAPKLFEEPRKSQFKRITEPAMKALKEAPNDNARCFVAESLKKELIDFFAGDQKMRYISCKVGRYLSKEGKTYYDYELRLSIDWETQWETYAVKLKTFQYMNFCLIDYDPLHWH